MHKSEQRGISRRQLGYYAGAAAVAVGAGGTGVALAATKESREALNELSNVLFDSPKLRRLFVDDPESFIKKRGIKNLIKGDLDRTRGMLADGWCCKGCGCDGG